jgi:putative DNA primase/helicase
MDKTVSTSKGEKILPLDVRTFPDVGRNDNVLSTLPNARHLVESYGITVRYNVVTKKILITVPGQSGSSDNADNVAMTKILSLASLNGLGTSQLPSYVAVIGDEHQYNPVADWIKSKAWDGVDRLQSLSETLVQRDDYPEELKKVLVHKWLISAVSAALKPSGFKARGVLTLQGPQSIGKTSWINALIPDLVLREGVIKLDHHLDAGNKDSLITAVSHWIVEIGELDSSFKKDIARLKGFLTSDSDKVRRPYARANSEYPRRTVFCATVNDANFLVDSTGNSRWWTIPVMKISYEHGIDMQQLFAQLAVDFNDGKPWWLSREEEAELETFNKAHRTVSVIHERVLDAIDVDNAKDPNLKAMTASEILIEIGVRNPTNTQCKECAAVLREYLGDCKRINGSNKWRIPLRQISYTPSLAKHENTNKIEDEF